MPEERQRTLGVTDLLSLYKRSATIHGLSHIEDPPLYCWRRFIWLFLVFGMAIGLSIIIFFEFEEYSKYETNTVVTAELQSTLEFPAVTICNLNQFHRSRIPLHDTTLTQLLYNLSEFDQLKSQILDEEEIQINNTPKEWSGEELSAFASDSAHRLDVMLKVCTWRSKKIPCDHLFVRTLTDCGYCFTFNKNITKGLRSAFTGPINGLRVVLDIEQDYYFFSRTTQAGVKVLLHKPDAPPLMSNHGIFLQPGTSTFVGINLEKRNALGPPYHAFGKGKCTHIDETQGFVNPVKRYPDSEYDLVACRHECLVQYLISQCGCRFFLQPGAVARRLIEEVPFIIDEDSKDIFKDTVLSTMKLDCDCPVPCKKQTYIPIISVTNFASKFIMKYLFLTNVTDKKNYVRDNMIDLRVYYESLTVTEINQKPSMTITGILGDLGGMMGLFLGASLLSLTEVLEILVLLVSRLFHRRIKVAKTKEKDVIVLTNKK